MEVVAALLLLAAAPPDAWPQFRGVGDSLSAAAGLPLHWSDQDNVGWRVDLAGFGQSSPIVWKDRVFISSVRGDFKETLLLECFDLATGRRLWVREFEGTQKVQDGGYVSKAAPTPAVDGERVYALFESGDLFAVDLAGSPLWKRSLVAEYGRIGGAHGLGASVVLAGGNVVVLIDHDGPSYLLACNPVDGRNVWKTDRGSGVSWSTPAVAQAGDRALLVVSAHEGAQAYDASNGREIWRVAGLNGNNVPSPTVAGGLALIGSDKVGSNVAIRLDGRGDASESSVAWVNEKATTTFMSVLVDGGRAYYVNRAGVLFCVDLATGSPLWNERIGFSCWASPAAAEGRVYFFGKDGATTVIASEPEFRKLAENRLSLDDGDRVYGAAIVDGAILLRAYRRLIRLGTP